MGWALVVHRIGPLFHAIGSAQGQPGTRPSRPRTRGRRRSQAGSSPQRWPQTRRPPHRAALWRLPRTRWRSAIRACRRTQAPASEPPPTTRRAPPPGGTSERGQAPQQPAREGRWRSPSLPAPPAAAAYAPPTTRPPSPLCSPPPLPARPGLAPAAAPTTPSSRRTSCLAPRRRTRAPQTTAASSM